MISVTTLMASTLDRELRSRGVRLPTAECEHILRIVISNTAAVAQAHETSRSAMPPAETPGSGGIGGDASAAAFSSAAREAMARKFERAFQCRLRMPHHDDLMHRDDPLIDGAELRWLASIIRGAPDQQSPSSAMPAPRTSDGGRDPSGGAPAVMPVRDQADRARGIIMAARAEEREICAKICDRWIRSKNLFESLAATDIAKAIRALPVTVRVAGEPE